MSYYVRCDNCALEAKLESDEDNRETAYIPAGWITVSVSGGGEEHYCDVGCLSRTYDDACGEPT